MSEFLRKLLSGAPIGTADWQEHLIEAHRAAPSMTPTAFSPFKTVDGRNSYEKLADSLAGIDEAALVVLDLACGDGALAPYCLKRCARIERFIGVDMSQAELAVASGRRAEKNVQWICAKAEELPLEAESVDLVLCHMAFMLMFPIKPVVSEIRRVLKKGGAFSAVVGNPDRTAGLFGQFQGRIRSFLKSEFPRMGVPKIGDPRATSILGLKELFNGQAGFVEAVDIDDFDLKVRLEPGGVWNFFKDFYLVGMLPPESKEKLKADMIRFADENRGPAGMIEFDFPMRRFSVHRSGAPG